MRYTAPLIPVKSDVHTDRERVKDMRESVFPNSLLAEAK